MDNIDRIVTALKPGYRRIQDELSKVRHAIAVLQTASNACS